MCALIRNNNKNKISRNFSIFFILYIYKKWRVKSNQYLNILLQKTMSDYYLTILICKSSNILLFLRLKIYIYKFYNNFIRTR